MKGCDEAFVTPWAPKILRDFAGVGRCLRKVVNQQILGRSLVCIWKVIACNLSSRGRIFVAIVWAARDKLSRIAIYNAQTIRKIVSIIRECTEKTLHILIE
jgi:hypothetical protein